MDYLLPWLVWAGATLLVVAGALLLTRWIKPLWLRDLLRLLAVATLLVPAEAGSIEGAYAPAWIVFLFEAFLQTEGDPVGAMMMLSAAWASALVVLIAVIAIRLIRRRRSAS